MKEFAEALMWTVLGIILDRVFEYIIQPQYKEVLRKYEVNKQKKLFFSKKTTDYLKNFYKGNLYNCKIGNTSVIIPFLTNHNWKCIDLDVMDHKDIVEYVNTDACKYPVHKKMIQKRIRNGKKIFNSSSLFLHRVIYENGKINFEVGEYDYFQRISYVHDFEAETYHLIYGKAKPKLRLKYLNDFNHSSFVSDNTVPFGCDVVLAIKMNNEYQICIHERSSETINYPNGVMVVPSFGFGGIKEIDDNPLFYSFLKEYCEELFDRGEMDSQDNHVNPYWFYQQYEEASDLFQLIKSGSFFLTLIGCGFDAIEGFFNVTLLARIEDTAISKRIHDNCKGNWETSNHRIKFVSLKSIELQELLQTGKLCPSSAFSVSRAIQYLTEQ